jgi:molybdopterin molybdotransferase
MRGFTSRVRLEVAWEWIDQSAKRLGSEDVSLTEAHGRTLASDVVARIDVPSFPRSAMDGYAVRADETIGATSYSPAVLRVIGESWPGRPFDGTVEAGTAVRIMTGAPLPNGADAVLPAEFAPLSSDGQTIEALSPIPSGKNVGQRGEDVTNGTVVLRVGRRLRPQDVGLLASVACDTVSLVRKPRVRLLITGNEIVAPGTERRPFQIVDSNSSMLSGLITRDGGAIESCHLLTDDRATIREHLAVPGADVILISGGSSVGAEDHAPTLIAELGELAIHGLAMRPSSPAGMGRIGESLVFLLPGNPVSCLCAYDFFAGRAIRLLGGRSTDWPYVTRQCDVGRKIVSAVGRVDYTRVRLVDGRIEPIAISGASILSSTTQADGFIIVPAELEGYAPGILVTVYLYDPA